MKIILLMVSLIGASFIADEDDLRREVATVSYIEQYAPLAVKEMNRSGIPASVILAQGIHESNSGRSLLATRANNHFGIKCKAYWKGATYYHEDDDYNKQGRLIESCFRAYRLASESYRDHTEFLINTSYYQNLFNFSKHNYEEWAKGLKHCGYATDPKYAEKLIRIIELYDLSSFDHLDPSQEFNSGTVLETLEIESIQLPENYRRKRYMDK